MLAPPAPTRPRGSTIARIRNTLPEFQRFAGSALDADPEDREEIWQERYRARHDDVFDVFFAEHGSRSGLPKLMRELRGLRARVQAAGKVMPELIEDVEPRVHELLGAGEEPEPLHVLLVGTMSANAFVAPLGEDLAVFHCLEWFAGQESAQVLVAHEDTHAWHRRVVGSPPPDDLAWTAFSEGLAVQVSRQAVPDRPEHEYFWYGVEGFEEWLSWCRENEDMLRSRFCEALQEEAASEEPPGEAMEQFFGGAFIEGHWRTGFFLADAMVASLEGDPAELYQLSTDEARSAIREAAGL